MMTVLVDKMIKMNILEPTIVQAWVFSEEMKVEFKRLVLYVEVFKYIYIILSLWNISPYFL